MNASTATFDAPSESARRIVPRSVEEPCFVGDWSRVMFIHFAVDPVVLRREVPFALDERDGRAFVSLVAFTMSAMRPRLGGRLGVWLARGFGESRFLNVRTYVRHAGETGIYFLAEWLSNWWSVPLGPVLFGLPYRPGRINYAHEHERGRIRGIVSPAAGTGSLRYHALISTGQHFEVCEPESVEEFLLERYTAFTHRRGTDRFFRVLHDPWEHARVRITLDDTSLIRGVWPWFQRAEFIGANYSPGATRVCMGRPTRLARPARAQACVQMALM